MTRIARTTIPVGPMSLAVTMLWLAGGAAAQTPLLEVEKSDATKLLQVNDDAGLVARGERNAGTIPATGPGVRFMWYPKKAAVRAGIVDGDEWDDGNIGHGSVAFGFRNVASGVGSTAFGSDTRAGSYIALNTGVFIGCDLPAGIGEWSCTSSRLAKEGFEDMDGETVLAKLAPIPIQRWHYLGTRAAHVGPTAEDFFAAFGLGEGPTTISGVDRDGIALLAVQALERRTAALRAGNDALRADNAELRRRLEALEAIRSRD